MKYKILNIFLVLILILPISACLPTLLLGAAGGVGSYFVGRNVSDREDRKVKTEALVEIREEMEQKQAVLSAQDTSINNELNQRLVGGAFMREIAIYPEIRNGVIILHGRVPDPQTAERVIQTARSTPGVTRIISNLVIVNQRRPVPMPVQMQQPSPQQIIVQQQPVPQQPSGFKAKQFSPAIPLESGSSFRYIPPENPTDNQKKFRPKSFEEQQGYYKQNNTGLPPENRPIGINQNLNQQKNSQQVKSPYQYQSKNSLKFQQNQTNPNKVFEKPKADNTENQIKTMSPEMLAQYSDNDSYYVKYNPTLINTTPIPPAVNNYQPVSPAPAQPTITPVYTNPYVVDVPVPIMDNDSYYTPYDGGYNSYVDTNPEIPVPVPGSIEDNDNAYELYYY